MRVLLALFTLAAAGIAVSGSALGQHGQHYDGGVMRDRHEVHHDSGYKYGDTAGNRERKHESHNRKSARLKKYGNYYDHSSYRAPAHGYGGYGPGYGYGGHGFGYGHGGYGPGYGYGGHGFGYGPGYGKGGHYGHY